MKKITTKARTLTEDESKDLHELLCSFGDKQAYSASTYFVDTMKFSIVIQRADSKATPEEAISQKESEIKALKRKIKKLENAK